MLNLLLLGAALASEAPGEIGAVYGPGPAPESVVETIVDLQKVRFERSRRSISGFFQAAAVELAVGGFLVVKDDPAGGGLGRVLVIGSVVHAASAWYQLETNHGRAATFASSLAQSAGSPSAALNVLARRQAFLAHRDARTHAFTAGLYGGIASMGLLGLGATAGLMQETDALSRTVEGALGLAAVGLIGVGFHTSRWRASVRLATDWDGLLARTEWP